MHYKKCFLFILTIYLQITSFHFFSIDETDVEKWDDFIEQLYQRSEGEILEPFSAVNVLVRDYLWQIDSQNPVLDIGCETGKNAICLIEGGHSVVLLDIAPKALFYTQENLKKLNLDYGIAGKCNKSIELLDPQFGPFKAVVGTYVFPFIHPEI